MRSTSPSWSTASVAALLQCSLLVGLLSAQNTSPLRFTDVARSAGIRFRHEFGAKNLQHILMTTGSGCALLDFDGDGRLDVFLVNGSFLDEDARPVADRSAPSALYRNNGDGTFEDVTATSGIATASYGQGCACADYDGDGHVDIYVTNYGPNKLWRNRGDGTFEDATAKSGTGDPRWGAGAVFFDYDGDLDLDLFVTNYVKFKPSMKGVHASEISKRMGFSFFPGPRDYDAEDHILYRNNGDGTFTDVSKAVGLLPGGKGLTVVAADFDDDGDQDVFVANDATPNFLYRNDGGRFTDVATEAGVAYDPDGVETAAMGVDIADVKGNGRLDIFVTNMIFEFNNMYVNQGGLRFQDETRKMGLEQDNYRHVGWATRLADFNHDGFLDCFVANGHVVDYVEGFSQSITYPQQKMLFLGDGKGRFQNVADQCGEAFGRKRVGRGGAFGDYDGDGDLDILVCNSGQRAELLRNDLAPNDRWVMLRLRGHSPNTQAIGARVRLQVGSKSVLCEVRSAGSYLSSSDPAIHQGLGAGVQVVRAEVRWPNGVRSTHELRAGALTVVEEPPRPGEAK